MSWKNNDLYGITKLSCVVVVSSIQCLVLPACSSPPTRVIASTGTSIGLEIAQNPATQVPHAKLGYQRAEVALVPTNRPTEDPSDKKPVGADVTAQVLMELKYSGIFSWGDGSGIYQRLAVGTDAVMQPGATMMFARAPDGSITSEGIQAIQSLHTVPARTPASRQFIACLGDIRKKDPVKGKAIDDAVTDATGLGWDKFSDKGTTEENFKKIQKALDAHSIDCRFE